MARFLTAVFLLALLQPLVRSQSTRVTIYWDAENVPSVVARTDQAALWGQGWASAEMQYFRIKVLYALAVGRGAELSDIIDPNLELRVLGDLRTRILRIPEYANTIYAGMQPSTKVLLDAYVQGLNEYRDANRVALKATYGHSVLIDHVTTPQEVIARTIYSIQSLYDGVALAQINAASPPELPTSSDGWCLRADVTSAGTSQMLLADPHISLTLQTYTQVGGVFGSSIRAAGCSFIGWPFIGVGAKMRRPGVSGDRAIAWTNTVSLMDQVDVFELDTTADGLEYFKGAASTPFTTRNIVVKTPAWFVCPSYPPAITCDPINQEITFLAKDSEFGIVVMDDSDAIQKVWAMQTVIDGTTDILQQFHDMNTAKTMNEFIIALGARAWSGGNFLIATDEPTVDADMIAYTLTGPVADRDDAELNWLGVTYIDEADDGLLAWDTSDLHAPEDFPVARGDVQSSFTNNNSGIAASWAGFVPDDYPDYMVGVGDLPFWPSYRQERSDALLADAMPVSFSEMKTIANDASHGRARHAIPLIVQAFNDFGGGDPDLQMLVDALAAWNTAAPVPAEMSLSSTAAPLYRYWEYFSDFPKNLLIPFPFQEPAAPWDAVVGGQALAALTDAGDLLECAGWPTWGEIHTLKADDGTVFPVDGGASALRSAFGSIPGACDPATGCSECMDIDVKDGQSCVMVIDLTSPPVIDYIKAKDNKESQLVQTAKFVDKEFSSLATSPAMAKDSATFTEILQFIPR